MFGKLAGRLPAWRLDRAWQPAR